jgi:hypothetical protein
MTQQQRALSFITLGVFVMSVIFSPWEARFQMADINGLVGTFYAPPWRPPYSEAKSQLKPDADGVNYSNFIVLRLRVESIAIEWIAIAAIYGVCFNLCKTTQTKNKQVAN